MGPSEPGSRRVGGWRWAVCLGVLVLTAALAVRQGPASARLLRSGDLRWGLFGLALFVAGHAVRAVRLRVLVGPSLSPWPHAAAVSFLHAALAYLLPLQTGDAFLPALLRWRARSGWPEGVGILLRARLSDLSGCGVWVALGGLASRGLVSDAVRVGWILGGVGLAVAPILLGWLAGHPAARWLPLVGRLGAPVRAQFLLLALSLAAWALGGASLFASTRAVGLTIGTAGVWLLVALQLPLQFLPVQGLGNAGTHELSWVVGLALLGVPAPERLPLAIATHVVVFGYVLVLAVLGTAATSWKRGIRP